MLAQWIIFRQATLCQCEDTTTEICRNEKPRVLIYGCLSHCHPIERKNIRLSKVTKDHALNLLQSGLRHGVIIEKYFAPINDEPDHKLVVPADLYRIEKTANLHGYDHKLSEVANVSAMLLTPSFLAFNFGEKFSKTGFPHGLQDKLVETSGSFLLCYASEPMLQRFQRHPTVVAIDGTHGTNASKFIMISINVFGMRNIGYSKFQTDYSICHQVEEEMLKYKVEQKFQGFEVVRKGPDGAKIARYRMMRNRFECNKQLCLVRCSNCPPESLCAHDYTCECPKYAYQ
eukprot:TCALIF_13071-PA protein Name:"Protein of unknown function" AED:0.83 eAED:0.83 QI:56/0/0.25/0.25/0.66/0.75/4/0/286